MQPVALDDVVRLLAFTLGRRESFGQTFDVGAPEVLTYRDLMSLCAEVLELKRPMLPIRHFTPSLSRLWVSLVTGAPRALVGPLVESLHHEMVARDHRLAEMADIHPTPVRHAMVNALAPDLSIERAFSLIRGAQRPNVAAVCSVQRMRLPDGRDAQWAALEYAQWLAQALHPLIRVNVDAQRNIRFVARLWSVCLLELRYAPERSTGDRQLYFVGAGLLSSPSDHGRLEFRQVLGGRTLLVAIHDYVPRLPWFVYLLTQAPFHRWVMAAFRRHLVTNHPLRGRRPRAE
jgi:hypothetical protein